MKWAFNRQAALQLTVSGPLRGRGLLSVSAQLPADPATALAALAQAAAGETDGLDASALAWLQSLGLLVPADQLSQAVAFEPRLAAAWPDLLPNAGSHARRPWPELSFSPSGPPPADASEYTALLPAGSRPLWPPQRPGELHLPFLPDAELGAALASLPREQTKLEPVLRSLLATAGWLQMPGQQAHAGQAWQRVLASARASLEKKGYAVLRRLINPLHAAALRSYIRGLAAEGWFEHVSTQVALRDVIHNQPLMRLLHRQLIGLIQPLLTEAIQPTYSILAQYHAGAELRPHLDRPQCSWNASLLLDAEPEDAAAWPIHFQSGEHHAVNLGIGDLVLYSGTDTLHWREPLPRGEVAVGLFHFVGQDFQGSLD